MLGNELSVEGARVDSDADGYTPLSGSLGHFLDVLWVAHVPGVHSEPVYTGLERHHRQSH